MIEAHAHNRSYVSEVLALYTALPETPLPDGYVEYMKSKLRKLAPNKTGSSPQVGGQTGA